jgi:nucleoside 2-deoxyribosyltransferase
MKIYLAIPYSFNPELSADLANKAAARLMQDGHVVFSPISHSHGIADYLPPSLRTDSHWWMQQDLPFVDWADEVHVVVIGELGHELIEQSIGVQAEIKRAKQLGKPVHYVQHFKQLFDNDDTIGL